MAVSPAPIRPLQRRDLLPLLAVLIAAAATRLSDLASIAHFSYDQATQALRVLDLVSGQEFPLLGQHSSLGFPHSPYTIYLLVPPYVLSDNPQVATAYIAALNVVAVGLLWLLGRRYFNPAIGFLAALAYALSPWAARYSRAIWVPTFLAPFLLLGILLALYGFWERKPWAQAASLPVLLIGVQLHYAVWVLFPLYLWIVYVGRRNVAWKALLVSVALALAVMLPFALGLIAEASTAGDTARSLLANFSDLRLRDKALIYAVRLATGLGGPWVGVQEIGEVYPVAQPTTVFEVLWLGIGGATLLGLVAIWRTVPRYLAVLVTYWALGIVLLFVPDWSLVFPHYFIASLPAFALLAGVGVCWLMARLRYKVLRGAVLGSFSAILLTQGVDFLGYLRFADLHSTPLHSLPMHYLLPIRDALAQYNDVLIIGGVTRDNGYQVWKSLLYRTTSCVRELVIAEGGIAVFPQGPFAALVPPQASDYPLSNLYVSQAARVFTTRAGEDPYTVHPFDSTPQWPGPALTPVETGPFDNGVRWLAYALTLDRLYLEWQLPDRRPARDYQVFVHFLDSAGERVGQRDASFWPSIYWCAGDRLITWIDVAPPPDAVTLRLGMYTLDSQQVVNSPILDAAGNPLAPWVDVPIQ